MSTTPCSNTQLHALAQELAQQKLPPGWAMVNSSIFARVACHAEDEIYYKEFLPRSPLETLKALFKGSRAERARRNSDALRLAGFDAPKNLAWGKLSGGREYLFTQDVGGQGITQWLCHELSTRHGPTLALRRQLVRELGTFIGRLHATGFVHGDLRTSNVLAHKNVERFGFALIDNERNVQHHPPAGKALLRNLMQLNMLLPEDLSRTDRWRFFLAWHRQMRYLDQVEARLLATEAYRWAMARLRAKGKL